MSISEIKRDARDFLKNNYGKVLGLCALYIVAISVMTFVVGFVSGLIPVIGGAVSAVATILVIVPLSYGFTKTLVKMKKGEEVNIVDFFTDGFNELKRAISTWWSTYWRKFLKTIPGKIITIIGVSLIFMYFMYWIVSVGLVNEDFQRGLKDAMSASDYEAFMQTVYNVNMKAYQYADVFTGFGMAGMILVFVGWIATIPFVLEYVIYEIVAVSRPDLDAAQVAEESKNLMIGNRFKYIGFLLSFAGWYILSLITCGLGFLFLTPYVQVARISFYESLAVNNVVVKEETEQPVQ